MNKRLTPITKAIYAADKMIHDLRESAEQASKLENYTQVATNHIRIHQMQSFRDKVLMLLLEDEEREMKYCYEQGGVLTICVWNGEYHETDREMNDDDWFKETYEECE